MPNATYEVFDGGDTYEFGLLVDPPGRNTTQTLNERALPGTMLSEIDNLSHGCTKITGRLRVDSFAALQTLEGAVGTTGTLSYAEELFDVLWVSLNRTQVVRGDIHICDVEFWIISGVVLQRYLSITIHNDTTDVSYTRAIDVHCFYGFDLRVSRGTFTLMSEPSISYNDQITLTLGTTVGYRDSNVVARLSGIVRDIRYGASPRSVEVTIFGSLQLAVEYENYEDPTAIGGLIVSDLVTTATGKAISRDIVMGVLDRALVSYTAGQIDGSGYMYGFYEDAFVWKNGTNSENFDLRETGESAMSYIERYDEIDATFTEGDPSTGGRWRTFNTVGTPPDDVWRLVVGGRPRNVNDFVLTEGTFNLSGKVTKSTGSSTVTGTGTAFTTQLTVGQLIVIGTQTPAGWAYIGRFTEARVITAISSNTSLTVDLPWAFGAFGVRYGVGDILDGQFNRGVTETRNYFVVTGYDDGSGAGPLYYQLTDSNDVQGSSASGPKHTFRLSSQMIERGEDADYGGGFDNGISCQTVANAISLDYNREIVTGSITTYRDDIFGIGQTHLVQALGGLKGRLGVAEKLWVQSLEISIDDQGFTQRITYIGGGAPDTSLPDPPGTP